MAMGTLFEVKGHEPLGNFFDMRQCKVEAIQDHINREEMMSLPLQNSTMIALDEKMHGYWLIRTSSLSEQDIAGIRIVTEGTCDKIEQVHNQCDTCRKRVTVEQINIRPRT